MRYPWWMNLIKGAALLFVVGLAIVILFHPSVVAALVTEETLRNGIIDPAFLDSDSTAAVRDQIVAQIAAMIVAASMRGAYLALGFCVLWLALMVIGDAWLIWRPGVAGRYFWLWWLPCLVICGLAIWLLEADAFWKVLLGDPDQRLPDKIVEGLRVHLMNTTTALAVAEFWLVCILVTPPTMQPSVMFAGAFGRLVRPFWAIGAERRESV